MLVHMCELEGMGQSAVSNLYPTWTRLSAMSLHWDPPREGTHPVDPPPVEVTTALKYLHGVFIYFDVISCVTLGTSSRLSPLHEQLIGPSSHEAQLEDVIGCENWVIILIGKISQLSPFDDVADFPTVVVSGDRIKQFSNIKERLVCGAGRNSQFVEQLKRSEDYSFSTATSIRIITYIYTLAALIYLQITATGIQDTLTEIRTNVGCIAKALSLITDTEAGQNLMWPVYIAGSVSIGDERDFFRKGSQSFSTKTNSKMSAKLKDIWRDHDAIADSKRICLSDLKCSSLLLL